MSLFEVPCKRQEKFCDAVPQFSIPPLSRPQWFSNPLFQSKAVGVCTLALYHQPP